MFKLIIMLLIFFGGCTRPSFQGLTKINVNNIDDDILLSTVVDRIRYIKLETDNHNLIGSVDKLIYQNGRFYILDTYAAKSIFVFREDGKFLFKINSIGRGPGEFIRPDDFDVDSLRGIFVLDVEQRKLIRYDLNGKYVEEIFLPFTAVSFAIVRDTLHAFYCGYLPNLGFRTNSNKMYNLVIWDVKNNKILKKYLEFSVKIRYPIVASKAFSRTFDALFLISAFNDTVYQIMMDGSLIKRYLIDFWDKRIPINFFSMNKNKTREYIYNELANYCYMVSNYSETKTHIFFTFVYKKALYSVFHSKLSGVTKVGRIILNDIDGCVYGVPLGIVGDELVGVIEPASIVANFKNLSPKLKELFKTINSLSNPILVFYSLKNF